MEYSEHILTSLTFVIMSKRKCLTLEDRVKVVKLLDAGKRSRVLATEFGVGRTQIQNVAKRKREIMEEYDSGNPELKRSRRSTPFDDVNDLCYRWFLDATSRQVPVSGPLLREKALKFASDLGFSDFKGSNGWLESFLKRNNIVLKTQSGKRAAVNIDANFPTCDNNMSQWEYQLQDVLGEVEEEEDEKEDDDEPTSCSEQITLTDASIFLDKLKGLALLKGQKNLFECVLDIEDMVTEMRVSSSVKQTTIRDFFKAT